MNILITGSRGQLGSQLMAMKWPGNTLYGYDLDMDITDSVAVQKTFAKVKPQAVIHCAAYTDVDGCEQNQKMCYAVNTRGTYHLVREAKAYHADFLLISTDYVFDGKKNAPYTEQDQPHPLSVYGDSKYQAEQVLRDYLDHYYLVRTTGIYSRYGKNFVDTIIKAAQKNSHLDIVNDQICTPTYSLDLARCVHALIDSRQYGVYHATNAGQCTWYDFACRIFELLDFAVQLNPIASHRLGRQAQRPAYSVLENRNLEQNNICSMRSWKEALGDFLLHDYPPLNHGQNQ